MWLSGEFNTIVTAGILKAESSRYLFKNLNHILTMGLKQFFNNLASTPTVVPQIIRIPNNNTGEEDELKVLFEPEKHYFTVRVNEMYLQSKRKWFQEIEPTVLCITSYIYGGQEIENPFIVGRNLLEANMKETADGMLFKNTRVAGVHPYEGGRMVVSMVLCKSVIKDYLSQSLEFIQNVSGVFSENITSLIGNYMKVAKIVIGGVDKLLDSKELDPLFGFRMEFDRDAEDKFSPGYFVIVKSQQQYDASKFYLKDKRLFFGNSADTAEPFTQEEYILFSITCSDERSDLTTLPFYNSYQLILDQLKENEISQDLKDKIKNMLRILNIEMHQSPDLTEPQAKVLIQKYINEVTELIEPKFNFGASKSIKKDFWDQIDSQIEKM